MTQDAFQPDPVFLTPTDRAATASELRYLRHLLRVSRSVLKMHFHRLIRLPVIAVLVAVMCWISIAVSHGIDIWLYLFWGGFGVLLIAWISKDMVGESRLHQRKFETAIGAARVQIAQVDARSVMRVERSGEQSDILLMELESGQTLVLFANDFSSKAFPCLSFSLRDFLNSEGEAVWHHIRYRSAKVKQVEQVELRIDADTLSPMQLLPEPPASYVEG